MNCFYDHPFKNRKSNNPLLNMMQMMMAKNQQNKAFKKPHTNAKQEQVH